MRVLIAEDTEDSRIMLEMALTAQGYEVISGSNGIEALQQAREHSPELIISDIMMPEMDGFEFCREVKADPELKNIPFIFYTATYTEHEDEQLAMALGASRFIIKPLEPQAFMVIIQEVLAASRAGELLITQKPLKEDIELEEMQLHAVSRKLDKKLRELEQEREALKKSEEKYRHLVESIQNYYFFYTQDTKGVFTYLSPSFELLLGYKPEEFLVHFAEFLTDNPNNEKVRHYSELSIKGQEQPPYEVEIMAKDGSAHWFEIKEVPVLDKHGHVSQIDGIAHDITERKRAEDTLRRSQKMDAIGQLSGGIAHDFNNLLGVILGNLEMLKMEMIIDVKVMKRVEIIKKSSQRAVDLTKQLLSFSRRRATQLIVTDINRVIREMESLIARSVTPEVEVEQQLAEDLWLTEIDPGDFEDALINLIINARDAMDGHGHLTIETRNTFLDASYCKQNSDVSPGEYVELAISDNGEGISSQQQERIFEPFYTTKEHGKGTGLGLAMVYGFVKRSDGTINVYSEQEIGTTFRLYLPRSRGKELPLGKLHEKGEILPRGTETLLVVDDEAGLLELARESLQGLGYQVLIANNGQHALDQLAAKPEIALLFSDVVMPGGINGYELADRATAKYPDLKVLLTSGYTGKMVSANNNQAFVQHNLLSKPYTQAFVQHNLLSKPYTQAELAKRIRELLDVREIQKSE